VTPHSLRSCLAYAALTALLSACTFAPRVTIESGYLSHELNHEAWHGKLNRGGGNQDLVAFHTAVRAEADVVRVGPIVGSLGIGPNFITPINRVGTGYGAEVAMSLRYELQPWFQPRIFCATSANYFDKAWEPLASNIKYSFITQIGLGARFPMTDSLSLTLDYRWYHKSWGESFYGNDVRGFFGLPGNGTNPGFEAGGVFVGVCWEF